MATSCITLKGATYARCAENATAQKHCCIEHATGAGEGRCLRNEVRPQVGAGLVEIDLLFGR